jgi:hypothetical protein
MEKVKHGSVFGLHHKGPTVLEDEHQYLSDMGHSLASRKHQVFSTDKIKYLLSVCSVCVCVCVCVCLSLSQPLFCGLP